jgi:hypothetical protein
MQKELRSEQPDGHYVVLTSERCEDFELRWALPSLVFKNGYKVRATTFPVVEALLKSNAFPAT